jgi:hypothetical protein
MEQCKCKNNTLCDNSIDCIKFLPKDYFININVIPAICFHHPARKMSRLPGSKDAYYLWQA